MNSVQFNAKLNDQERRNLLYNGQILVYSPTPASLEFCNFTRKLVEGAFAPHNPLTAQFHMPAERYVEILAKLKPEFIHHQQCKELIQELFSDFQCDLDSTFFDVPRLRTMTHGDYLTAGLAYAFHPHRDTWFSAPPCQLNWWIPVYDIQPENTIAFYPEYWSRAVKNSSAEYNYYRWNRDSRGLASKFVKNDTRKQPQALETIDPDSQVRVVCEAGGIIIFSGSYMHSTVPNTSGRTRFSIDFRTVHLNDVQNKSGAVNVDSSCTGTTLRDFLRGTDFERMPETVAAMYDECPPDGDLIFRPTHSEISQTQASSAAI